MGAVEAAALELVAGGPLLDGRVVVLTGATGGIGGAIAQVLSAAGARVAAVDLDPDAIGALAVELAEPLDASDLDAFGAFCERVEADLGPIDGLVNCAGSWSPLRYDEIGERAWEQALQANLRTAFAGCRAVLPRMVERRAGSVVNIASTAGEYGSITAAAHYAAAKGGVIALTKSLAREVGPAGVRVNAVSPGPIDTVALLAATPAAKAAVASRTLLGRLGRPDEIACACVYLLGPLSSFVTGHVLRVNGGSLL